MPRAGAPHGAPAHFSAESSHRHTGLRWLRLRLGLSFIRSSRRYGHVCAVLGVLLENGHFNFEDKRTDLADTDFVVAQNAANWFFGEEEHPRQVGAEGNLLDLFHR